jgi:hypothetical protein
MLICSNDSPTILYRTRIHTNSQGGVSSTSFSLALKLKLQQEITKKFGTASHGNPTTSLQRLRNHQPSSILAYLNALVKARLRAHFGASFYVPRLRHHK